MSPADATGSPSTSEEGTLQSPPASPSLGRANIALQDLCDSRGDLLGRINNLKKDLQEWRGKLDTQVKTYKEELGDLKNTLNLEVEQLKSEFEDLRKSLRKQLDDATNMGSMVCSVNTLIHGLDKKMDESVPDLMKETNMNKVEEPGS
ncbi:uncharacterized protein LOC131029797 isoform X2 [Cryptomeria japonica]|uniref:uncharacterized protein LOC131029797 isoform X2 n=1 Tax=Cryptomeria japonica TaxID=3369 RepID=UPI0025ACF837|nr:uncharacterized protein LOC131029797 isoform X2 [Cryptomeria japonica]